MSNQRPFGLVGFLLLLIVFLGAAAIRAGYLLTYADSGATAGPIQVQETSPELRELITNVKDSTWFGDHAPFSEEEEQTADHSPGYPWLVGLLARLVDAAVLDKTVRWIQVGLGALTAAVYFLFALRAFSSRVVALLAGAFAAVYPFWVSSSAEVNDAVLAGLLLALAVYLGTRAVQTHGPFASLLFGLSLAGLALVRAATLPFGFVALAWFLLRSRHESRGWLCALLAFLGFVNGLVPWTIRNYQAFGEPLPVVSSAWLHLWIGNNENANGGPETESMLQSAPAGDLKAIKNQPQRYARLSGLVWDEVRQRPVRTVERRIWAGLDFLWGERFFTAHRLADPTKPDENVSVWEFSLLLSLLILYALAFLGWRWTYAFRKECVPATLAVIWLPLPYLLSHAGALHGPRLPLDGVLLCYAAFALCCLIPGIGGNLLEGRQPKVEGEEG